MKNFFQFEGKIDQRSFVFSFTGVVLFFFLVQIAFDLSRPFLFEVFGTLGFTFVYSLIAFIALLCLIVELGLITRRLHSLNKSGWYALCILVPFVNLIFILFLLFAKGNNRKDVAI